MNYPTYQDLVNNILIRLGEERNVEGNTVNKTPAVSAYLKAIPMLMREALSILALEGPHLHRSKVVTSAPGDNILGEQPLCLSQGTDREYSAPRVGGWAFEMAGPGKAEVYVNGALKHTYTLPEGADFTLFRGYCDGPVRILMKGGRPYLYRNVALYRGHFESEEEVPPWQPVLRFAMKELDPQFYRPDPTWAPEGEACWEGPDVFRVDGTRPGCWEVRYLVWPSFGEEPKTQDPLPLDPAVYTLVCLYVEGRLRAIHDEPYAAQILAEFESRRRTLQAGEYGSARAWVKGGACV